MAQIYDQYVISFDGQLDVETTSVKFTMDGKDVPIETIIKGFAGITPSPKTWMIDVEDAIPVTGFQIDVFESFLNSTVHNISIQAIGSGKVLSVDGFVQAPSGESGVGKASKLDFKLLCEPGLFA